MPEPVQTTESLVGEADRPVRSSSSERAAGLSHVQVRWDPRLRITTPDAPDLEPIISRPAATSIPVLWKHPACSGEVQPQCTLFSEVLFPATTDPVTSIHWPGAETYTGPA